MTLLSGSLEINVINSEKFSPKRKERKEFEKLLGKTALTISKSESRNFNLLNVILCNDRFIKEYNRKYLGHNYETDIITFYYNDEDEPSEGELIVSLETVYRNAERYKKEKDEELLRVLIHGMLHLCGYNDKKATEKKEMRNKENKYLRIIRNAGKDN